MPIPFRAAGKAWRLCGAALEHSARDCDAWKRQTQAPSTAATLPASLARGSRLRLPEAKAQPDVRGDGGGGRRRVPLLRVLTRSWDGVFRRRHLSSPSRTATSSAPPPAAACSACRRSIWKRKAPPPERAARTRTPAHAKTFSVEGVPEIVLFHVNLNSRNQVSI